MSVVLSAILKTLAVIGWLFATISVVMLIRNALEVSLSSSALAMLDYYEAASRVVFGWAEPLIQARLFALKHWLGLDLYLYPHWKHVFVLLMVYISVDTRTLIEIRWPEVLWPLFQAVVGALIAVAVAVLAGCVQVSLGQSAMSNNLLIAAIPTLGISVFLFVSCLALALSSRSPRNDTFLKRLFDNGTRLMQGFFMLLFGVFLLWYSQAVPIDRVVSPWLGVGLVAASILGLGISFLVAAYFASPKDLLRPRHGRIGVYVLAVFAGVLLFVIANAGLRYVGM